ncbi:MAG: hypothetical protein JWN04_82 [Myxococcaceae bacterium]|nr:hypothetical protein [Myxococcaceae bacterium]
MPYREERELVIRLHLSAEFGPEYEGDDDGYEWHREFDTRVRPALVRELLRVLTAGGEYRITPINRGLDAHEELELSVERIVG